MECNVSHETFLNLEKEVIYLNIDMMVNKSGNPVINKDLVFDENKDIYKGCTLLDDTSILNPSILIIQVPYEKICKYNYMRIPAFNNRYYYITDIIAVKGRGVRVNGRVDVLRTYRDDILASKQLISRQENKANYLLPDACLVPHAQSNYTAINFGKSLKPDSNKYYIQIAEGV